MTILNSIKELRDTTNQLVNQVNQMHMEDSDSQKDKNVVQVLKYPTLNSKECVFNS